ncbi:unnamed protein product [Lathyrus sativus]|nr:unnamed protein product [Lathyrus sativus]
MLFRSLHSSRKLQYLSLRRFSSATPLVLKPGHLLKKARVFTQEDVIYYSNVSHDSNHLHADSTVARNVGLEGPLVHGVHVASLFKTTPPYIIRLSKINFDRIQSHLVSHSCHGVKHFLRYNYVLRYIPP